MSDSVTPWTVAHQAPLSMGFSRQEYRGGLPCPPPGDLRRPGIQPRSLLSPASVGGFWEAAPKCAHENERVIKGAAAESPSERLRSEGCDGPGRGRWEPRWSAGRGGGWLCPGLVSRPLDPWREALCGPGFRLHGLGVCMPRVFSPKERPCPSWPCGLFFCIKKSSQKTSADRH